MEHVSYLPPLAFHGFPMDDSAARYKDALRLGLPFHLEATYLHPVHGQKLPCGRLPAFPFHGPFGVCDYAFEPAFIRKRNERERHRVRCVNEGYARLREHLPQELEDKRLSKVETLRAAIDYIKHLKSLLDVNASGVEVSLGNAQRTQRNADGDSKPGLSNGEETVY
ncbi:achaete-scute homolog 4-like [Antennarius striatus]|uniref:achaete-scute homolog 4-like n=1 Tax=Antennarius striatus TaxID=241820 RepID=UPI0035B2F912